MGITIDIHWAHLRNKMVAMLLLVNITKDVFLSADKSDEKGLKTKSLFAGYLKR